MVEFAFEGIDKPNEYIELIKMFLRPSEFRVATDGAGGAAANGPAGGASAGATTVRPGAAADAAASGPAGGASAGATTGGPGTAAGAAASSPAGGASASATTGGPCMAMGMAADGAGAVTGEACTARIALPQRLVAQGDKNAIKRFIFDSLADGCGLGARKPEWGILTGVRPVKLFGELAAANGLEAARAIMRGSYYVSEKKLGLVTRIHGFQRRHIDAPPKGGVGLYIGIPFCPTRCEYCSFPSNQKPYGAISQYLGALRSEILAVSGGMEKKGLYAETVYIGGGTPTTLNEEDLDGLLGLVNQCFRTPALRELTVEAGRPDTVTEGKLDSMTRHGVTRISINPQSMNSGTLSAIGRDHSPEDIHRAFAAARQAGLPVINADIIAGLPGEEEGGFEESLNELIGLGPDNITVHTLAVKRAAKLKENDSEYSYSRARAASLMLGAAERALSAAAYEPYYLYRQKQTAGNLENTGYTKGALPCLYNVRIMEENQSIVALGAGASSKAYYPEENRLERVFNVSNYEIYIERLPEMLERKAKFLAAL